MQDINNRIRDRIEEFVSELDQLVRQAAVESVSQALGEGRARPARRGGGGGAGAPRAAARASSGGSRSKGAKRAPEEIEATVEAVRRHVQKSPGGGVEAMAKAIGKPTRELVLPIKKLMAAGEIRTTGEKRATKYFPGRGRAKGRRG
jgi:hypothetical protein